MACYISSNENRFYVAAEDSYGAAAAITSQSRFAALGLAARQQVETAQRRDKTGSRTFPGLPAALRKRTQWELKAYMEGSEVPGAAPRFGALLEAALGAPPSSQSGLTVQGSTPEGAISFAGPHGLAPGQAVAFGGEIRFVAAVPDAQSIQLNVPLSGDPGSGAQLGAAISYGPASGLGSVTLYDYWSPISATHRIVSGAAVDEMRISVNGDFHELSFHGPAVDVLDSASFEDGQAGLAQFPEEPAVEGFSSNLVPGHLGQIWMGSTPSRFYTVSEASIRVLNHLETRTREFGSSVPRCLVPGTREVLFEFSLYERDSAAHAALYQAARQRSPIQLHLQLGEAAGQMCGVYVPGFVPEVPEWDDSEARLQWRFRSSRAIGTVNDEIYIAFA